MTAIPPSPTFASRFSDRYDSAVTSAGPTTPLIESLLDHRSVRSYSAKPLPDGAVEQMLASAQSASSSSNLQLWSAILVEDPGRRERLSRIAGGQRHVLAAPLFLVWVADLSRAERVGRAQNVEMKGTAYMEAFVTALIDTSLAAQNAMAAAESMGLGGCYIGAMRNDPQAVARELALPPQVLPLFGMCVGWPDTERPTSIKPRLPQRAVLHREVYSVETEAVDISEYDKVMERFQHGQGMTVQGWSQTQVGRLRDAAALDGRDKLLAAIHQLGFDLI